MAQANSLKSIFYALSANGAIAVAKGITAVITGSGAMLAEAIHSVADCGNQLLLLWGLRRAKRPPTPAHPMGYGKAIYFWSFIVAVMLFTVGGMFSLYEGVHKWQHPEPLNRPWLAIGVLVFAIAAEGASLLGCLREINKVRGDRGYGQWFRSSRSSALIVIFGEDLAALLGLTFALLAIGLAMATGESRWDALGSMAIGVLLIVIAVLIGGQIKALLIGEGVEASVAEAMRDWLRARPEVDELFNLLSLHFGDDVMVAVKARMAPTADAEALIHAINAVEADFREAFPQVAWLFFEPDLTD